MTRLPPGPSTQPRFEHEDDEGQYYLSLLRDGSRDEQLYARDGLARVFARRQMLDEAAELYETNILEGVRDPDMYRRLATVYRRQGKYDLAEEVLIEAERLDAQPDGREPGAASGPSTPRPALAAEDEVPDDEPRSSWRSRWQASILEPADEPLPGELDEEEEPDDIPPLPRRSARSEEVEASAHERVLRSVAAHTARARSAGAERAGGGRLGGIILAWAATLLLVLGAYLAVSIAPLSAGLYLLAALLLLIVVASPLELRIRLRLPPGRGATLAALVAALALTIAAGAVAIFGPSGGEVNLTGPAAALPTAAPLATPATPAAAVGAATVAASALPAPTIPLPNIPTGVTVAPLPTATPPAIGDVAQSRITALPTLGTMTPPECSPELGFAALRTKIGPDIVGDCTGQQTVGDNGDIHQPTTTGELVWRKVDGRTAFTDGYQTWIDGPNGVEKRLNGDRFVWEAEPSAATPTATPFPLPTPLAGAIIPQKRVVAYYGNPLSDQMGVLGEGAPEQMLARLKDQCRAWQAADPSRPVQPALQLVAVVAQGYPGDDNKYRLRMSEEQINQVMQWADSAGAILILDIQPGRSTVKDEVQWARPFLRRPNVHLALDPEFTQRQDQVPGDVVGSMDAAAINDAVQILDEVVRQDNLPPKILIVHRFTDWMVTNYRDIRGQNPRVQVVVDMDGFGSPQLKIAHYNKYVVGERVAYTGIKLFYRHDDPLMTPKQVLDLDPPPDVVIYQ